MILFAKKKQVAGVYILYIASIIMNLIPVFSIAFLGVLLFLVSFIANYILKYSADKQSMDYGHYAYMTKTIWIFSFLVLIGLVLSYFIGDHAVIINMMQSAQSGVIYSADEMMALSADYIKSNMVLFAYFIPVTLHLIYRMAKGFYKAHKGLPIKNPKSWL